MRLKYPGGLCVVLVVVLGEGVPCLADEVRLLNGDRLTGEIEKMEEGTLTLKTAYGGTVSIDWKQVHSLTADKPLAIQLHKISEEESWTDFLYQQYVTITASELGPNGPVPLEDVKAINPPAPIRIDGTFNIGGNRLQGNANTAAVNGATRWTIRSDRHRLLLEGKYNYGEANSQVSARNSLASLNYDFFLRKHIFLNGEALFEKDSFQNLTLRSTGSGGIGYQVLDRIQASLAVVLGLSYVEENYMTVPTTKTPSTRWAVRSEFAIVPERVKVFHKHEGYYDFATRSAIRFFADQGIRVTVYENLFLNLEYDFRYNGAPAPGRKKVDEALIFGVGYEFS